MSQTGSWVISTWTPDVAERELIIVTVIQGFAIGTMFLPLQVLSFVTLEPHLRTQASALFSLARNMGGALGIAVLQFLLVRNGQILHSEFAAHMTPFHRWLDQAPLIGPLLRAPQTMSQGAMLLDGIINKQAAIIAFADDFRLMAIASVPVLLLTFIVRKPKAIAAPPAGEAAHVMD